MILNINNKDFHVSVEPATDPVDQLGSLARKLANSAEPITSFYYVDEKGEKISIKDAFDFDLFMEDFSNNQDLKVFAATSDEKVDSAEQTTVDERDLATKKEFIINFRPNKEASKAPSTRTKETDSQKVDEKKSTTESDVEEKPVLPEPAKQAKQRPANKKLPKNKQSSMRDREPVADATPAEEDTCEQCELLKMRGFSQKCRACKNHNVRSARQRRGIPQPSYEEPETYEQQRPNSSRQNYDPFYAHNRGFRNPFGFDSGFFNDGQQHYQPQRRRHDPFFNMRSPFGFF